MAAICHTKGITMQAPVSRLKKTEIVWLANNLCNHSHTYLDHYNCYLKEKPDNKRIGIFDIEATSLKANAGFMLSWCIKEYGTDTIWYDYTTKKDIEGDFDGRIVRSLCNKIKDFDEIVTYFGTGYDLPFCRTRAEVHGLQFGAYGEFIHRDVFYTIKSKFNLTRKSQEIACKTILGPDNTDKNHYDVAVWLRAARGDADAIAMILDHNERDVCDLEKLFDRTEKYRKRIDRSA